LYEYFFIVIILLKLIYKVPTINKFIKAPATDKTPIQFIILNIKFFFTFIINIFINFKLILYDKLILNNNINCIIHTNNKLI
jgi:hypothetical protein